MCERYYYFFLPCKVHFFYTRFGSTISFFSCTMSSEEIERNTEDEALDELNSGGDGDERYVAIPEDEANEEVEEENEEEIRNLLNEAEQQEDIPNNSKKQPFDCTRVDTWGCYIEQPDQEVTHEQLYLKLRSKLNLHQSKGLRCLLKLLDCVVIWAERSQAYYVAGKNWQQEGNLYQGQLLLDTLRDTIAEFVSRLGPYQVFHNQEAKRDNIRPDSYPQWKRVPHNGSKLAIPEIPLQVYTSENKERALVVSGTPNTIVVPSKNPKSRRRTMTDLGKKSF